MYNVPVQVSTDIPALHVQKVRELFNDPTGSKLQINPKTLRLHARLIASKNTYTFFTSENPTGDHPLDIKLTRNNAFVAFGIGLWLKKEGSTSGSENYGNYPYFTFPDPNYFVGNNTSNPEEFEALYTVYNGNLDFITKPVNRLEKLSCTNFLYVPEKSTQKQASPMVNDEWPSFGPSESEKGMYRLASGIIIDGGDDNQFQLNLASGDTTVIAGGLTSGNVAVATRNTVAIIVQGYEVVGGSRAAKMY